MKLSLLTEAALEQLLADMRVAHRKAQEHSDEWNKRDIEVKARSMVEASHRGMSIVDTDLYLAKRKSDDPKLKDLFGGYVFWRDEANRLSQRLMSEAAAIEILRNARQFAKIAGSDEMRSVPGQRVAGVR